MVGSPRRADDELTAPEVLGSAHCLLSKRRPPPSSPRRSLAFAPSDCTLFPDFPFSAASGQIPRESGHWRRKRGNGYEGGLSSAEASLPPRRARWGADHYLKNFGRFRRVAGLRMDATRPTLAPDRNTKQGSVRRPSRTRFSSSPGVPWAHVRLLRKGFSDRRVAVLYRCLRRRCPCTDHSTLTTPHLRGSSRASLGMSFTMAVSLFA